MTYRPGKKFRDDVLCAVPSWPDKPAPVSAIFSKVGYNARSSTRNCLDDLIEDKLIIKVDNTKRVAGKKTGKLYWRTDGWIR